MTCPFLEHRSSDDGDLDRERLYCGILEEFVSPTQADVCNDRYEFAHDDHCEAFVEHVEAHSPRASGDD